MDSDKDLAFRLNVSEHGPAFKRALRLTRNLFNALVAVNDDDNPNVRQLILKLTQNRLHASGMFVTEDAIRQLEHELYMAGTFDAERQPEYKPTKYWWRA